MSDFLSNLIANVQKPAEVIQPHLGPLYGFSSSAFSPSPDERVLDFVAETEGPASGEPSSVASLAGGPVPARSSGFSRDAQSPRPHDSLRKSEIHSSQTQQQRPMPFQREPLLDSSFSPRPSLEMDSNYESPSFFPTDREAGSDDSLRRNAGEEAKPHLGEEKAARQVSDLNIPLEMEKAAASRARGDIVPSRDQAKPSPLPDFHTASRREERFAARVALQPAEIAAPVFSRPSARSLESMPTLPRLRPDTAFPQIRQNLNEAEKPEPIIRVNIGRIEVRAVTPPATPRSNRARPGPPLSLEDYLKQRNGGQR